MNTTKRLIEQLEKLTNKKVILREEAVKPDLYYVKINGDSNFNLTIAEVIKHLREILDNEPIEMEQDFFEDEFGVDSEFTPDFEKQGMVYFTIEKFVNCAVKSGVTFEVTNDTLVGRGDDYCNLEVGLQ